MIIRWYEKDEVHQNKQGLNYLIYRNYYHIFKYTTCSNVKDVRNQDDCRISKLSLIIAYARSRILYVCPSLRFGRSCSLLFDSAGNHRTLPLAPPSFHASNTSDDWRSLLLWIFCPTSHQPHIKSGFFVWITYHVGPISPTHLLCVWERYSRDIFVIDSYLQRLDPLLTCSYLWFLSSSTGSLLL